VTAVTAYDPIGVDPAPVQTPGRRNVLLVGTLLACAAGASLIGSLLAGYFGARDVAHAAGKDWLPKGTTLPNTALFVAYIGLVISAFTAHWAHYAIKIDDRRQAYMAFATTAGLGLLFVNAMTFCWTEIGLGADSSPYALHMYSVSVVHTLLVIAAVAMMVVVGFRVFGGSFTPRNSEPVAAAVIFWDFVVVAGVVVWWCLWFLEGGPG